jgi:hypothetical protein
MYQCENGGRKNVLISKYCKCANGGEKCDNGIMRGAVCYPELIKG